MGAKRVIAGAAAVLAVLSVGTVGAPVPAGAAPSTNAITGRVSALAGPTEPTVTGDSSNSRISGDGRYVAFESKGRFSPLDTNNFTDIYVRDLLTDQVELISVSADGKKASGAEFIGGISDDGRYVAFASGSNDLVVNDANGFVRDIFVRDRQTDTTIVASKSSSGVQVSTDSSVLGSPVISGNGRYVLFTSRAPELLSPASNTYHLYVRDLVNNFTERISISTASVLANNNTINADISYDGRYVVFSTLASNLGGDASAGNRDVYRRDRTLGITTMVGLTNTDVQPAGGYDVDWPSISDDGQKVAFITDGAMTTGDTTAVRDVFVRDISTATTTKASIKLGGGEADLDAGIPELSGDGTTVAWGSRAGEYIAGGGNGQSHVFKRVGVGAITRESVSTAGVWGTGGSAGASLSTDGKALTFQSGADNLVSGDTGKVDIFVRRKPEVGPHGSTSGFSSAMVKSFTGATNATLAAQVDARIGIGSSPERELIALAEAPAFAAKRGPLVRLYSAYFKRLPDNNGLNYWLNKISSGMKLDEISAKFAASSEFKTKYGNTTNSQFVTLVYNNVLNRAPDSTGLNFWVAKLQGGMSRGTVMTNFSESPEGKRKFRPYVDTALISLGMMGKLGPVNLITAVFDRMKADSPERGATRLLTSAEYAAVVAG